jgi:hypothetical protein
MKLMRRESNVAVSLTIRGVESKDEDGEKAVGEMDSKP